jgi:hypothetical protein
MRIPMHAFFAVALALGLPLSAPAQVKPVIGRQRIRRGASSITFAVISPATLLHELTRRARAGLAGIVPGNARW